jgi:actin-related protein 3
MQEKVVVIDNGTGYTKMGYAGNLKPTYDFPTLIADMPNQNQIQNSNNKINPTLDFYIG